MKVFFGDQFKSYFIIWTFHGCSLNSWINRHHELSFRIINNDKHWNFEETLIKGNFVSANNNNDHALTIATYKMVNGMSQ